MSKSAFFIKQRFNNYEELEAEISKYEESTGYKLSVKDSKKCSNDKFEFIYKVYQCTKSGIFKPKGKGYRNKESQKLNCPFMFRIRVDKTRTFLEISQIHLIHNHNPNIDDLENTISNGIHLPLQTEILLSTSREVVLNPESEDRNSKGTQKGSTDKDNIEDSAKDKKINVIADKDDKKKKNTDKIKEKQEIEHTLQLLPEENYDEDDLIILSVEEKNYTNNNDTSAKEMKEQGKEKQEPAEEKQSSRASQKALKEASHQLAEKNVVDGDHVKNVSIQDSSCNKVEELQSAHCKTTGQRRGTANKARGLQKKKTLTTCSTEVLLNPESEERNSKGTQKGSTDKDDAEGFAKDKERNVITDKDDEEKKKNADKKKGKKKIECALQLLPKEKHYEDDLIIASEEENYTNNNHISAKEMKEQGKEKQEPAEEKQSSRASQEALKEASHQLAEKNVLDGDHVKNLSIQDSSYNKVEELQSVHCKSRGRPRGTANTAIGLQKKKTLTTFANLNVQCKLRKILTWISLDPVLIELVISGECVLKYETIEPLICNLSDSFLDDEIDIGTFKNFFEDKALRFFKISITKKRDKKSFICLICNSEVLDYQKSIRCDLCLVWYHTKCLNIKLTKKLQSMDWFCPLCYKM